MRVIDVFTDIQQTMFSPRGVRESRPHMGWDSTGSAHGTEMPIVAKCLVVSFWIKGKSPRMTSPFMGSFFEDPDWVNDVI